MTDFSSKKVGSSLHSLGKKNGGRRQPVSLILKICTELGIWGLWFCGVVPIQFNSFFHFTQSNSMFYDFQNIYVINNCRFNVKLRTFIFCTLGINRLRCMSCGNRELPKVTSGQSRYKNSLPLGQAAYNLPQVKIAEEKNEKNSAFFTMQQTKEFRAGHLGSFWLNGLFPIQNHKCSALKITFFGTRTTYLNGLLVVKKMTDGK